MRQSSGAVRWIAGVVVVLMAGCSSPTEPSEPSDPLPVTRITSGSFSKFTTPQRRVIRSQDALLSVWAQVFGGPLALPPPLPAVDFSSEMVILVAAGERPTSGYCITVEAAAGDDRAARVSVLLSTPLPGGVLTVITQPFEIVRIPRRDEVTFEERQEARACEVSAFG